MSIHLRQIFFSISFPLLYEFPRKMKQTLPQ